MIWYSFIISTPTYFRQSTYFTCTVVLRFFGWWFIKRTACSIPVLSFSRRSDGRWSYIYIYCVFILATGENAFTATSLALAPPHPPQPLPYRGSVWNIQESIFIGRSISLFSRLVSSNRRVWDVSYSLISKGPPERPVLDLEDPTYSTISTMPFVWSTKSEPRICWSVPDGYWIRGKKEMS